MRGKKLSKIVVGICLVLILAVALPLTSACTPSAPTTAPTPTPSQTTTPTPGTTTTPTTGPSEIPTPGWQPPASLQWITPSTSSTGFISSSAMLGTLGEKTGVQFRVVPGAATMDRAVPLRDGSTPMGMLTSSDTYTALNALLEFSDPSWGPQSWRNVYTGGPVAQGIFTPADSGIETSNDVLGRKYCRYPTYPSVQIFYMTAFLAYCNLTWDDVIPIDVGGYADGLNAVLSGKSEMAFASATAPQVYELEASIHGLRWLWMPASETEAWARFHEINPFFYPYTATGIAGGTLENPQEIWAYDYGVRAYDWQDPDLVYWMTSILWEYYDDYKNTHPFLLGWTHEHQLDIGAWFCPWHDASVKFFKDEGLWTSEMEAAQQELLAKYPQKSPKP